MTPLLLWMLAGCSADLALTEGDADEATPEVPDDALRGFHLHVQPVIEDVDGGLLLPQQTGPHYFVDGVDALLDAAVQVSGAVRGERLTPWAPARLPAEPGPMVGEVRLTDSLGAARAVARTDSQGGFVVLTLPGEGWLSVSPEDPRMPAWQQPASFLTDTDLDVDAGVGVPLWGRVTAPDGQGVDSVGVFATSEHGAATATSFTDADGWFELRVGPGVWTPVATGRVGRREPLIVAEPVTVGAEGARVDLAVRPTALVDVGLQVVDRDGAPVTATRVALSTREVDGYAAGAATFQVEALTDSRGDLVTRVPAGIYQVEVLPEPGQEVGGVVLNGVDLRDDATLDDVVVPGLAAFTTLVVDARGEPLADVTLRCEESTSWPRAYEAVSGPGGDVQIVLPDAPLTCTAFPARADVALRHLRWDPTAPPDVVALADGVAVRGLARTRATLTPVPLASVRLFDLQGTLRGVAVTGDDGGFELAVDWGDASAL